MILDFEDKRYSVAGYKGIAFWLKGYPKKLVQYWALEEDEYGQEIEYPLEEEWIDDLESGQIIAVMVGDDMEHIVSVSDLEELSEDDFCSCCGQIGCGWS